jgi:glycerol kinase
MAACIGHGLFKAGSSKNTYGTGLFLLSNIGERFKIVPEGLLTSILYQRNAQTKPIYAFEGSVECGGSTINWARD